MGFSIKQLPYLPDFSKLVNTMISAVGCGVNEVDQSEYLDFLKSVGIIETVDSIYRLSKEWTFLYNTDNNAIKNGLWEKMEKVNELLEIVRFVGSDGKTYDDIIKAFANQLTEQTVRVILSWMEYLDVLYIKKGCYFYNENEVEAESDEEEYRSKEDLDEIDVKDVHFSFFDYLRKINEKQIILNPDFQRNKVWKGVQKSQFIESAILGLPLPPIYFKKDNMSKLVIVDGLQRTTAIQEFMGNKLRLEGLETLKMLNGFTFKELKESKNYQGYATRVEDTQLFCYILQKSVPMSVVYDIFNRINTGGTKLSRQEIRNCLFIGHSTRLVKKLSENHDFRKAIDNGISKDRMKDREAVLRCLAFRVLDYEKDYTGSMDSFLEKAMRELNKMSDIKIQDLEKEFLKIMKDLTVVFGNRNFRIYDDYTRGRINIAVMESVYLCMCKAFDKHQAIENCELEKRYEKLIRNSDYLFSVRNSTSSKSKVTDRFNIAQNYLLNSI